MRKKKLLSLLLAVAMMFSLAAAAHAVDDVAEGTIVILHTNDVHVGPANANDHQSLGIALDLGRCGLNAGELLFIIILGQTHPAGEVPAQTGAVLQPVVGAFQQRGQAGLIGFGEKILHLKQFDIQHHSSILSYVRSIQPKQPLL